MPLTYWIDVAKLAAMFLGGYLGIGVGLSSCIVWRNICWKFFESPGPRNYGCVIQDIPSAFMLATIFWPIVWVGIGIDRICLFIFVRIGNMIGNGITKWCNILQRQHVYNSMPINEVDHYEAVAIQEVENLLLEKEVKRPPTSVEDRI
jgi:hypothetical protein